MKECIEVLEKYTKIIQATFTITTTLLVVTGKNDRNFDQKRNLSSVIEDYKFMV